MTYIFKANQEAIWFVLVAAGTVVVQALAAFDPATIVDWRAWAVGIAAAAIRASAGAALTLHTSVPTHSDGSAVFTDVQLQQVLDALEQRMKAESTGQTP